MAVKLAEDARRAALRPTVFRQLLGDPFLGVPDLRLYFSDDLRLVREFLFRRTPLRM